MEISENGMMINSLDDLNFNAYLFTTKINKCPVSCTTFMTEVWIWMKWTFIFVFIHTVDWIIDLVVDLEVRDIIIDQPETATTFQRILRWMLLEQNSNVLHRLRQVISSEYVSGTKATPTYRFRPLSILIVSTVNWLQLLQKSDYRNIVAFFSHQNGWVRSKNIF